MKKFIEFIEQWYKSFPQDKLLHYFVCYFIATIIGIPTYPAIGFAVAVVIGLLKEILDWKKGGKFSYADFMFDILGAATGVIWLVMFG